MVSGPWFSRSMSTNMCTLLTDLSCQIRSIDLRW